MKAVVANQTVREPWGRLRVLEIRILRVPLEIFRRNIGANLVREILTRLVPHDFMDPLCAPRGICLKSLIGVLHTTKTSLNLKKSSLVSSFEEFEDVLT